MLDVGLTRQTTLALVRLLGEAIGAFEELRIGLGVVRADLLQDRSERVRGPGLTSPQAGPRDPGEPPAALGRDGLRLFVDSVDRYVLLGAAHTRLLHPSVGDAISGLGTGRAALDPPQAPQNWMKLWTS
jgi:hypothetical protein